MEQSVIESGRAEFALKAVTSVVKEENDKTKKEYRSYVRSFPSLVLSNGLAAAVAFAREKGSTNKTYMLIYCNISEWLASNKNLIDFTEKTNLDEYICSLDSDSYRIVSNEVLSLFKWLKRFASGQIAGES